jgi:phosphate transport system permease protein
LQAAQAYRIASASGGIWRSVLTVLTLSVGRSGLIYALRITNGDFRARNRVEAVILGVLLLGLDYRHSDNHWHRLVDAVRNHPLSRRCIRSAISLFGLTWSPNFHGSSELGLLPLLWGTLYISFVAMVVAVPTGLFTAIYLAEYASPRVRSVVKPLIEVIAGIPTVVFGLFALGHGRAFPPRLVCHADGPWIIGIVGDDGGSGDRGAEHPVHLIA